jgi:hypothetical protein
MSKPLDQPQDVRQKSRENGSFYREMSVFELEELEVIRRRIMRYRLRDLVGDTPQANPAVGIYLTLKKALKSKLTVTVDSERRAVCASFLAMKYALKNGFSDVDRVDLQMDVIAISLLFKDTINSSNKWRIPPSQRAKYRERVEEELRSLEERFPRAPSVHGTWRLNRDGLVTTTLALYYMQVGGYVSRNEYEAGVLLRYSVFGLVNDHFRITRRLNPPGFVTESMAEGTKMISVRGDGREKDIDRVLKHKAIIAAERERRNRRIFRFLKKTYQQPGLADVALKYFWNEEFINALHLSGEAERKPDA